MGRGTETGTEADFGVEIVETFQRVDQLLVCPFAGVGVLRAWLLLRQQLLLFLGRLRDRDVYGWLRHGERGRMGFCFSGATRMSMWWGLGLG